MPSTINMKSVSAGAISKNGAYLGHCSRKARVHEEHNPGMFFLANTVWIIAACRIGPYDSGARRIIQSNKRNSHISGHFMDSVHLSAVHLAHGSAKDRSVVGKYADDTAVYGAMSDYYTVPGRSQFGPDKEVKFVETAGSRSRSILSRAVSFPFPCTFAISSLPPPRAAFALASRSFAIALLIRPPELQAF
jgi:hypothetical protein